MAAWATRSPWSILIVTWPNVYIVNYTDCSVLLLARFGVWMGGRFTKNHLPRYLGGGGKTKNLYYTLGGDQKESLQKYKNSTTYMQVR